MNKWTSAVATAVVMTMIAGAAPAWAETGKAGTQSRAEQSQLSKEQAVQIVRDFLGARTMVLTSAALDEAGWLDGELNWMLTLMDHLPTQAEMNAGQQVHSISASVNARTGEVTSFRILNPEWAVSEYLDAGEAKRLADRFLQEKFPKLVASLRYESAKIGLASGPIDPFDATEVFYAHTVNGIPVAGNYVIVEVDQYGHVVGFRDQERDADADKLPDPIARLSEREAQQVYEQGLQMEKVYQSRVLVKAANGSEQWVEQPMLGYRPKGQILFDGYSGKAVADVYFAEWTSPREEIHSVQGLGATARSYDDVKQVAEALTGVDVDVMEELEMPENRDNPPERAVWTRAWQAKEEQGDAALQGVFAVFDQATGQLIHLELTHPGGEVKPPAFSEEQARQKALDILRTQLPAGQQGLMLRNVNDYTKRPELPQWYQPSVDDSVLVRQENVYRLTFNPMHSGIPVVDQQLIVEIGTETGQLVSVYKDVISTAGLPADSGTITAEQAKAAYLQAHPLKLRYYWPEFGMQRAPFARLVYEVGNSQVHFNDEDPYIDAFTGQSVD